MMETLNEFAQLRDSEFGQPWPRHGLKLLYWFANHCFSFKRKNIMLSKCDPANRDFGFHLFENRYDDYGDKLLPDIDFPYYVVGNLYSPGAEELPDYVSEDTYTDQHNSNTDRIIVSLYDEECFHRVYVTQHHDRSNYDPNATYRISRGLLMNIRRRSLEDFLEEMGYYTYMQSFLSIVINYRPQNTNTVSPSSSDSDDSDPPETQRNHTNLQIEDNKRTGYYTNKQPVLPTPVFNYRPITTNTVSPDFTAVTPSSSDSDDSDPPETQRNHTKIQFDDNEMTGYYKYTHPVSSMPVFNYRPQTTNTVSQDFTAVTPSCSGPAHTEPPATQRNHIKIQLDDEKKTGYYTNKQPVTPTPVSNYRPQTTNTVSPDFTAVTPSSSGPAHTEPPATQRNHSKIQLEDNKKTVYYTYKQPVTPTPVFNYRPQTTNTVSPDFTAVTPSPSDSDDSEPETESSDSIIQFDDYIPSPKKKGLCQRCCTIL